MRSRRWDQGPPNCYRRAGYTAGKAWEALADHRTVTQFRASLSFLVHPGELVEATIKAQRDAYVRYRVSPPGLDTPRAKSEDAKAEWEECFAKILAVPPHYDESARADWYAGWGDTWGTVIAEKALFDQAVVADLGGEKATLAMTQAETKAATDQQYNLPGWIKSKVFQ